MISLVTHHKYVFYDLLRFKNNNGAKFMGKVNLNNKVFKTVAPNINSSHNKNANWTSYDVKT